MTNGVGTPIIFDDVIYVSAYVMDFGLMAIPSGLSSELSLDNILWMQIEKNSEVPSPLAY